MRKKIGVQAPAVSLNHADLIGAELSLVVVRDGLAQTFLLQPVGDAQHRWTDELTVAEARVLRYLPSNLTAWEIAGELGVSTNTVKTHMRHIYAKLDAHRRREAVERAWALGVLGPARRAR